MPNKHEVWKKLNRKAVYFTALLFVAAIAISSSLTYIFTRPPAKFPLGYEANFMASCLKKGANAYACDCSLRYVEDNYAYSQALALDQQATKLPRGLQQAFYDCHKYIPR